MRFFDAHCHFFTIFKEFYSDFLNFSAENSLCCAFINTQIAGKSDFYSLLDNKSSKKNRNPFLLFFEALHPWETETLEAWEQNYRINLENRLNSNKKLFIGETGLDRFRGADIETQKKIFRSHIELALKYERPFTVHCVREWGNCLEVLRSCLNEGKKRQLPFIMHGFTGSFETMKDIISLGGFISFSASMIIRGNKKVLENIERADPRRIFIETDFPCSLSDRNGDPVSFSNGKEAGKAYIDMLRQSYSAAADIMNISIEELGRITEENGKVFTDYSASG